MAKLTLKGSKKALSDLKVQWEIIRQILDQDSTPFKKIQIGKKVHGVAYLEAGEAVSPVIDIIKSRIQAPKYSGEIDVFDDIAEKMTARFKKTIEKMASDLEAHLGVKEELKKAYPKEWFKPPAEVAKEASLGLKWRRKYKRGGLSTKEAGKLGIGSGVQRAVDLKHRDYLSPETIKRMVGFFARHKKNKNSRTKKGEPGAGMIAWLLWGGDAGEKWSNAVLDKMEQADLKKANERADTPAEPHEQIEGSNVNKEGSASDEATAEGIILDDTIIKNLKEKVKEHNSKAKMEWQKVSLNALKAVFRRGAGAFSVSHRPSQNRQSWAYARVNAFLEVANNKGNLKYTQDDDLLHPEHPRKEGL
jgi:hypothetical protein